MAEKTILKNKPIFAPVRTARQQRIAAFFQSHPKPSTESPAPAKTNSGRPKASGGIPETVAAAAKINGVQNYINKNLDAAQKKEKEPKNTVLLLDLPEKKYAPGAGADVIRVSSAALTGKPLNFMRKVRQKVLLTNMKIEDANNESHKEILKKESKGYLLHAER